MAKINLKIMHVTFLCILRSYWIRGAIEIKMSQNVKKVQQAGAELGQAQLKLGLDFSVDLVTLDLIC